MTQASDIGAAVRTNQLLTWWQEKRAEREQKILNEMIAAYRNHTHTYELLLSKVAAIAELRSVELDLQRDLNESIDVEAHHAR